MALYFPLFFNRFSENLRSSVSGVHDFQRITKPHQCVIMQIIMYHVLEFGKKIVKARITESQMMIIVLIPSLPNVYSFNTSDRPPYPELDNMLHGSILLLIAR